MAKCDQVILCIVSKLAAPLKRGESGNLPVVRTIDIAILHERKLFGKALSTLLDQMSEEGLSFEPCSCGLGIEQIQDLFRSATLIV